MILALEGPDCCGKTTMFNALRPLLPSATFVPRRKATSGAMRATDAICRSLDHAWQHLYDPTRLYVTDRFFAISEPVYAMLYEREYSTYTHWGPNLRVVYFNVSHAELCRRYALRGDRFFDAKHYDEVRSHYEAVIGAFTHWSVDEFTTAQEIVQCTTSWWLERECSVLHLPELQRTLAHGASSSTVRAL